MDVASVGRCIAENVELLADHAGGFVALDSTLITTDPIDYQIGP
ncbi:hypothetical protein [Streptomyces roseochromogenus]|uniref:Uncharacterized protein n=1 Tax=Streptomyces roseochromogenus subsp. oscitans DS 12.976 TaxID=1352936 RepID=V6KZ43_STRRC|nr:hypothetical protein [Streptomyces roseochromogenus]EST36706.1 hypothetical protein M878_01010 [Streptomyces roseochromogenus subsp. oscitans DS 12.976]